MNKGKTILIISVIFMSIGAMSTIVMAWDITAHPAPIIWKNIPCNYIDAWKGTGHPVDTSNGCRGGIYSNGEDHKIFGISLMICLLGFGFGGWGMERYYNKFVKVSGDVE